MAFRPTDQPRPWNRLEIVGRGDGGAKKKTATMARRARNFFAETLRLHPVGPAGGGALPIESAPCQRSTVRAEIPGHLQKPKS